ncbi:helix-turn-helix domain-containing protein [Pseudodesulfovibrio karagichevae]|uniref:Helix-turn-helix domain-containing protein n=1 Tax=Pseudodesulfovibrio karagichevae TaxID=3239305 RepID=A0ABV4K211_9BACT
MEKAYMPEQPFFELSTKAYVSRLALCDRGLAQYYSFVVALDTGKSIVAVPDGTVDIVIQCSGSRPAAQVCGSVKKGTLVKFEPGLQYFGARFFPGTADELLRCPLNQFTDQRIPLGDVYGSAEELVERICTAESFGERIRLFEKFHEKRIRERSGVSALVLSLIDRINRAHGDIRIGELAEETGFSVRHISNLFSRTVGISPKFYSRIVRFQRCFGLLRRHDELSYANLAQDGGYYDQAHLINEFREFSLCTPAQALGACA